MMTAIPPLYYVCAWIDSGFLITCDHHYHLSVTQASACCSVSAPAGSYVVAVENWEHRRLNAEEEAEYQNYKRFGFPGKEPQ